MSWRRFCALLEGLSPQSATVAVVSSTPNVIEDPEAAERAVDAIW